MDPARALPSYWVYRGSLLALVAGSVVALWLLVFPPERFGTEGRPPASIAGVLGAVAPSATPAATPQSGAGALPRVDAAEARPAVDAAPPPTPAAIATPTATPTAATPTPAPAHQTEREYTVEAGDTISGIVTRFLAPGGDREEFQERIVELNGIADVSQIQIGQVITIPAQ